MMSHYAIFAFGIFVGSFLGFFVISLCHIASEADKRC